MSPMKDGYLHNKWNSYIIYYKLHGWIIWIIDLKGHETASNEWQVNALVAPANDVLVTLANGKSC